MTADKDEQDYIYGRSDDEKGCKNPLEPRKLCNERLITEGEIAEQVNAEIHYKRFSGELDVKGCYGYKRNDNA